MGGLTRILSLLVFILSAQSVFGTSLSSQEKQKLTLEQLQSKIAKEYKTEFSWKGLNSDKSSDSRASKAEEATRVTRSKEESAPSKGESKVAKLLAIQREKIRKMREKSKSSSGATSSDWMAQKSQASKTWMANKVSEQGDWQKKKLKALDDWAQAKEQYKKDLPKLKKDLTDLSEFSEETVIETKDLPDTHIPQENELEAFLLSEDFSIPIRTQGMRATCSAFAAVRSMEIILRRKGRELDLSEQFFYYASKPKCQSSPCVKKGSWPAPAFRKKIPLEQQCPYTATQRDGNETQIPLLSGCNRGRVRVSKFSEVKSRNEIHDAIRKGFPVIGGFKLNEVFYKNEGLVFLGGEPESATALDRHAQGHALIMIGVLDLPKSLWSTQGKHCTLVTNSWGEGWGLGGHACLSDRWFYQYRYQFAFLAIEDISLN